MKKYIVLILSVLSTSAFSYDNNGCESIKNLAYKCNQIISLSGQGRNISDVEICIGSGGLQSGIYLTSENLSADIFNWKKRNITNVVKNNSKVLKLRDKSKSITGCILNPGSACYREEVAVLDKEAMTLTFDLKFSTSKFFLGGWTNDVSLKLSCEKL